MCTFPDPILSWTIYDPRLTWEHSYNPLSRHSIFLDPKDIIWFIQSPDQDQNRWHRGPGSRLRVSTTYWRTSSPRRVWVFSSPNLLKTLLLKIGRYKRRCHSWFLFIELFNRTEYTRDTISFIGTLFMILIYKRLNLPWTTNRRCCRNDGTLLEQFIELYNFIRNEGNIPYQHKLTT